MRLVVVAVVALLLGCDPPTGFPVLPQDAAPRQDVLVAHDAPADTESADAGVADGPLVAPALPEDLPAPLPAGAVAVELATYNTGLAPTLLGSAERLPLVIEAIKTLVADVVCLNEVWLSASSQEAFAAAVASAFPYAYWNEERSTPMGNGLLVLSKHPLYRGRAPILTAQDYPDKYLRKLLAVDVVTPTAYFHVMCTHLAADTTTSEAAKRQSQIEELNALATTEGYFAQPTFLLGDLNAGPDPVGDCTPTTTPACLAPDLESYALLLETWTDPNEDWQQCTWCRAIAEPLQLGPDVGPSVRIDHCLYANLAPATFTGRRLLFDQAINVVVGTRTVEHLSDHLGVGCGFGP